MATNHQSATTAGTAPGGGGPRLSSIGSPTLGGGSGTPVKACKKVLPPAIPLEFLQRRNSQNLRQKDDETPTNAEMILPQQTQAQMTTAIVHQQPAESLDDSALGYYATSNGKSKWTTTTRSICALIQSVIITISAVNCCLREFVRFEWKLTLHFVLDSQPNTSRVIDNFRDGRTGAAINICLVGHSIY